MPNSAESIIITLMLKVKTLTLLEKLISYKFYFVIGGNNTIILVKIEKQTYRNIDALVHEGKYTSTENFVDLAIRNQLLLEEEGRLGIVEDRDLKATASADRFQLSVPAKKTQVVTTSPLNNSIREMPIWGQVNRLAPAKLVLRVLLNSLARSDEKFIDLKRFGAEAVEKAIAFRLFAKKKDKTNRVRGTELYVAFPKRDLSSQQRFLTYYVGKAPLQRWTDSVLMGLSLASIEKDEEGTHMIGLTELGLQFALLHSPLVDDFFLEGREIASPFSNDEVEFLVENIRSTRLGEFDFLKFTLISIKNGADTPVTLQGRVNEFLKNKDFGFKISDKVTNTMQVGAIGRLLELGLLKIEKDAQRSKYVVSERGEQLI